MASSADVSSVSSRRARPVVGHAARRVGTSQATNPMSSRPARLVSVSQAPNRAAQAPRKVPVSQAARKGAVSQAASVNAPSSRTTRRSAASQAANVFTVVSRATGRNFASQALQADAIPASQAAKVVMESVPKPTFRTFRSVATQTATIRGLSRLPWAEESPGIRNSNLLSTDSTDHYSLDTSFRCSSIIYCPICMTSSAQETITIFATKCGHVFCSDCLKNTVARLSKCPICQRNIRCSDFIQLFV